MKLVKISSFLLCIAIAMMVTMQIVLNVVMMKIDAVDQSRYNASEYAMYLRFNISDDLIPFFFLNIGLIVLLILVLAGSLIAEKINSSKHASKNLHTT